MESKGLHPRVFQTGAVYLAKRKPHDMKDDDDLYLVLGPCPYGHKHYFWSEHPVEYRYLDLLTGKVGEFHRDSYFAERAELL